ncbi:MAG: hypothetical protein QNJ46_06030 [Leptolyngbyaceae cyanobacterium MO_188.B28]|nr:hypothetical protein [Leptolyngbyaceae cyanobacterium MO_188.B28]
MDNLSSDQPIAISKKTTQWAKSLFDQLPAGWKSFQLLGEICSWGMLDFTIPHITLLIKKIPEGEEKERLKKQLSDLLKLDDDNKAFLAQHGIVDDASAIKKLEIEVKRVEEFCSKYEILQAAFNKQVENLVQQFEDEQ